MYGVMLHTDVKIRHQLRKAMAQQHAEKAACLQSCSAVRPGSCFNVCLSQKTCVPWQMVP